ncbi:regulator, partial [Streptomyces sp. TRM76130]|nr:regulator [Streptomyces sp. TRM76130]
ARGRRRSPVDRGPGLRVGAGDLAALRSVGDLFRSLDDRYGGGHARQALVRYLEHELEPMLRGSYGEQAGRR